VLSYAGQLSFAILGDADAVPDLNTGVPIRSKITAVRRRPRRLGPAAQAAARPGYPAHNGKFGAAAVRSQLD
jgi:hypothetical protein